MKRAKWILVLPVALLSRAVAAQEQFQIPPTDSAVHESVTHTKTSATCDFQISCGQTKTGLLKGSPLVTCTGYGIVNGQAWVSQYDTYHFQGEAGQTVSATLGQRLGMMDPILFLVRTSDSATIAVQSAHGLTAASVAAVLPAAGDYTIGVATFASGDVPYELVFACSTGGSPDLRPYHPGGWSDSLVLSTTAQPDGSTTFSSTDTVSYSLAVENAGTAPVVSAYNLQVLLDGVAVDSLQDNNDLLPGWFSTWAGRLLVTNPTPGTHTVTVKIDTGNVVAESNKQNNTISKSFVVSGRSNTVCVQSATTLCLSDTRFKVVVAWSTSDGRSGQGQAVPMSGDTGNFWFFDSANVELLIKVLDGRGINNHFWIFYGALSDVSYTITVTDAQTGAVKQYQNQQGTLASVADTSAF